jgi:hypothetical protein
MFIAPQRAPGQGARMLAGLPVAIALLAEIQGAAPAAPPSVAVQAAPARPPEPRTNVKTASGACVPTPPSGDTREIVVCAPRPQGYRLNPDVLEANRAKRTGRPKRPERLPDTSCASVGPFGCTPGAGIDLIGGAVVAATMVAKAIRGENVGEMFVTDPQRSEYDYYVEAKRRREALEAEAAAIAAAKAKAVKDPAAAAPKAAVERAE